MGPESVFVVGGPKLLEGQSPILAPAGEKPPMMVVTVQGAPPEREIYLMPFMLAQKYARPWAIMTAYVEGLSPRRSAGSDDNQLQPRQWSLCIGERAPPTGYPPKGVEIRRIDHE